MVDISSVGVSEGAMAEGRWLQIVDEFEVRVRSIRSPAFQQAILDNRDDSGAVPEELFRDLCASALITDWRGLTENGQAVPFDAERCEELFLNEGWEPWLEKVQKFAVDVANFRAALTEAAAKN